MAELSFSMCTCWLLFRLIFLYSFRLSSHNVIYVSLALPMNECNMLPLFLFIFFVRILLFSSHIPCCLLYKTRLFIISKWTYDYFLVMLEVQEIKVNESIYLHGWRKNSSRYTYYKKHILTMDSFFSGKKNNSEEKAILVNSNFSYNIKEHMNHCR